MMLLVFWLLFGLAVIESVGANAISSSSSILKGKIQIRGGNNLAHAYAGGIATAISHTMMLPMGMYLINIKVTI